MQKSCFQDNILMPPPGPNKNFPNLSIPPNLCLQTCSNHPKHNTKLMTTWNPNPPSLKSHHPTHCICHKKHGFSSLSQLGDLPSTNSTINSCLRDKTQPAHHPTKTTLGTTIVQSYLAHIVQTQVAIKKIEPQTRFHKSKTALHKFDYIYVVFDQNKRLTNLTKENKKAFQGAKKNQTLPSPNPKFILQVFLSHFLAPAQPNPPERTEGVLDYQVSQPLGPQPSPTPKEGLVFLSGLSPP